MVFSQGKYRFIFCLITILLLITVQLSIGRTGQIHESQPIILLTGFKPFASFTENPSEVIASALNGSIIQNALVYSLVLPINFTQAVSKVTDAIEKLNPIVVINLGMAPSHHWINVETLAINLKKDPEQPNATLQKISEQGPWIYQSTLPAKKIAYSLREQEIPARRSIFAGTYLCNTVMYTTLQYLFDNTLDIPSGFIHVPPMDSQESYGMDVDTMVVAVQSVIQITIQENNL